MIDQGKNILIGVFVVAACAIAVFMLLFLHPTVGNEGKIIRVRFANIDKVNLGTRVTYAGKPVGEIVDINEVETVGDPRIAHDGFIYPYELVLKVDTGVNVYNTDVVSLRTSGLLGEKSVAIMPLPPLPGQVVRNVDKETLYANETGSVEETLKEFKELSDKFELALDSINIFFKDIKETQLIEKVSKIATNVEQITSTLNKPKELEDTLYNIQEFAANIAAFSKRIDGTFTKFDNSMDKLQDAMVNLKTISEDGTRISKDLVAVTGNVAAGKGTFGKLLMGDDFYLRTSSIMSKVETLADDVNHYGLLFHMDKNWQKLRARRANLLYKLSSPQEFRNFFNDEIDEITTSLSRVARILEETEAQYPCGILLEDYNFSKVFAELMRRVSELEENLRLYNTQLVEAEVSQTELTPDCCTECCE